MNLSITETNRIFVTDHDVYRPTILEYFRYHKQEISDEISTHCDHHGKSNDEVILKMFADFRRVANEYEKRVTTLIAGHNTFDDVKKIAMNYVADLMDRSNKLIDIILLDVH